MYGKDDGLGRWVCALDADDARPAGAAKVDDLNALVEGVMAAASFGPNGSAVHP